MSAAPDHANDGHRGAEAVVDVHDGHAGRAAREHPEHRREATERHAVADRRGYGDHRRRDETADDAGERALHAGDDDERACLTEPLEVPDDAMEAGDADVEETLGYDAAHRKRLERFFGDGNVARPRGDDGDERPVGRGAGRCRYFAMRAAAARTRAQARCARARARRVRPTAA